MSQHDGSPLEPRQPGSDWGSATGRRVGRRLLGRAWGTSAQSPQPRDFKTPRPPPCASASESDRL